MALSPSEDPPTSSSTPSPSPPSPSTPPEESPPSPPATSSPPPSPPSSPPPAQTNAPPPPSASPSPPPPIPSPPPTSSSSPPPLPPGNITPPPSPPPPIDSSPSFVSPPPPSSNAKAFSPPPPPHKAPPSHTPSSGSSPSSSPSPSSSSSLLSSSQTYLILGVVTGAGLLLLLVVIALTVACTRKTKKKPPSNYYMDQQKPIVGEHYYNGGNSQRTPPQRGNNGSLAYPTGVMPTSQQPGGGWQQQATVPTINSGEMSGSYSSPYSAGGRVPPQPTLSFGLNTSTFSYEELAVATNGFAQDNILGQGGFGYVLKGVLPTGKEVAVKCLRAGSGQGDREFQAEVEIISRVHHRHLVSLVGYCIAGEQRMLVYEFVPNMTLEYHLHGSCIGKDRPPMDWPTRLKIAIGMAKGIAYLHEDCHPRIIHRDIKAANILLDMNFEAKVADFGLAKLSSDNFTHVSTRIMGTFGYLAPEYAASGKLTEKSDVFSFGVMLLEIITGRKPIDTTGQYKDMEESLVDWARPLTTRALEEGDYSVMADPSLRGIYNVHEMARMIVCAGACIRHTARIRPKMSKVVHALEGNASLDDLHDSTIPGSSSSAVGSGSSEDNTSGSYTEDMKRFRKMAFQNHDYASSEFGATSEYGLNPSSSSSESPERSAPYQARKRVHD